MNGKVFVVKDSKGSECNPKDVNNFT
jgi:hypothetical protein